MPFEVVPLQTTEPVLLISRIFEDERGYFFEPYKKSDFEKISIKEDFVQDNVSYSVKGVLWNDPDIGIEWGIGNPILSLKDQKHSKLKDADNNFMYIDPYKKSITCPYLCI